MKSVKKFLVNRTTYLFAVMMLALMAAAPATFAADPAIVTNAKKLAQDALTWVLVLIPVTGALMVGYHAWMKSMADGDPGAIAERNKKIKNTIVGSVIGVSASGIVTALLAYF
ncbi:hypothetical protein [Paenibacillus validus]|uniref:hypothetical protein n=1 Tax=Paenibacillus validus TaxID=44253 RepID=UPI003D2DE8DE